MISRSSAILISQAYHEKFAGSYRRGSSSSSSYAYKLLQNDLYDFLFIEGYDAWFLNLTKLLGTYEERALREFLMKVHTGESLYPATKDWSWKDREKLGQTFLKDLAESILRSPNKLQVSYNANPTIPSLEEMRLQLELDGYIWRENALYETEASIINEQAEQDYLGALVDQANLGDSATIKHHLKLAQEHYGQQKWDDSISNSRKFLEAILSQSANSLLSKNTSKPLSERMLSSPRDVRDLLEREGLLGTKEKEAIAKVYGLLSDTGAHPNIAHKDQARLMWHLALTFAQFVLLRLQGLR